jgi:fibrillarin-like pre-rRNA processing protein
MIGLGTQRKSGENTNVNVKVRPHPQFPAIFKATLEDGSQRLATKNLTPGRNVYDERLLRYDGVEYRVWDAFRSKLAAAILKGLKTVPIKPDHQILYLGAASGTTASHVSDIVGEKGHVYCVEFASRSIRELVNNVCAHRLNMSPILEDARLPEKYAIFLRGRVDDIYCDIAQPEQARVLADNAVRFLKESGWAMLAVKAQSIDVTREPSEVYRSEARVLEKRSFRIEEVVQLEPYDKAHAMIVAQS